MLPETLLDRIKLWKNENSNFLIASLSLSLSLASITLYQIIISKQIKH